MGNEMTLRDIIARRMIEDGWCADETTALGIADSLRAIGTPAAPPPHIIICDCMFERNETPHVFMPRAQYEELMKAARTGVPHIFMSHAQYEALMTAAKELEAHAGELLYGRTASDPIRQKIETVLAAIRVADGAISGKSND